MRKRVIFLSALLPCLVLWGCVGPSSTGELLVVNFEQGQPLRYRMVSERQTLIDLAGGDSGQKSQPQTMSERLELVMVYTPVQVDPFGLTTLKATCEIGRASWRVRV